MSYVNTLYTSNSNHQGEVTEFRLEGNGEIKYVKPEE